jgi:hypothetical protein
MSLRATKISWTCSGCGEENRNVDITGVSVGSRLLDASAFEFARGDYSRAIVFAAMAVECQLTDTYKRWAGDRYEDVYRDYDEETIEDELRRWGGIRRRLEEVGKYLSRSDLEQFVSEHPHLRPTVEVGYPTTLEVGSVIDGLERNLFWKRNRVLHFGYDGFTADDAKKAFNLALFGLQLIEHLHRTMALESARSRVERANNPPN